MNDRIRLAEAMGVPEWEAYCHPAKNPGNVTLPDPFTDANDCEAVIRFMAEKYGVVFTVWYPCADAQTAVDCSRDGYVLDRLKWQGKDWKQGVCELALKVIK